MRLNNCWPPLPTLALEKILEGGGVFLLNVQHGGEYISTMFGCV